MSNTVTHTTLRDWVAIVTLGVGSFAIVTAELAPIGLLSQISADLDTPPARVGLIVTLYAWIAAFAALLSGTVLHRIPRRPLLIALMLILSLSGAMSAIADEFTSLMTARVIGSFAHGAFWAMIGTIGAQIVPPHRVGLATSIIFGGVSAASVLGVPLANLIGTSEDWRTAFGCISALSLVVAGAIWIAVPSLPGVVGVNTASMFRIASNRRFQRLFAATALAITAHFMAYTYVELFLTEASSVPVQALAPLLFAFGAAGVAANVLTGAMIDNKLKKILLGALMLSSGSLFFLATFGPSLGGTLTALVLITWGGAVAAIFVGFQTWILKEARDDALPASAIYVAIFNAAIGLGAMLGSIVLAFSGLTQLFLLAAIATVCGVIAIVMLREPSSVSVPAE